MRSLIREDQGVNPAAIFDKTAIVLDYPHLGVLMNLEMVLKHGLLEAMKFYTNVKTYSLPWPR